MIVLRESVEATTATKTPSTITTSAAKHKANNGTLVPTVNLLSAIRLEQEQVAARFRRHVSVKQLSHVDLLRLELAAPALFLEKFSS